MLAEFGVSFDKEGNLAKGDKQVDGFTEKLLGMGKALAGAFAVKEIINFGQALLQEADALAKQSQSLGVSTAELQGWQHAAALSGSSAEEFSAAFTKFTRNVNEAGEAAGGPAAKAFKELGVSLKDGAGNLGAPIDLLDGVVAGLEGIQDPAKRTALVMDLFGKSGARLLPLFSEGQEGLKRLRAEVQELGFGFDEAFLENAQEVNDNVDRLKSGLKGVGIQILSEVLPGITAFTKQAVAMAKSFIGWLKGTRVVQAALVALSARGMQLLLTSIPKLIAKLGGLQNILLSLGRLVLRTALPFLLLEDAIGFLQGDDSAIGAGLDSLFGSGTAEAARAEILKWFNDVKNVVVNDFLPALRSIATSALFTGAAKGALDAVLFVLSAIGLALTDNADRAEKLAGVLKKSASALGLGPTEEEAAASVEKGLPENREELSATEKFIRKGAVAIFGDPLDKPELKANAAENEAILARRKMGAAQADAIASKSKFFGPTATPAAAPSYYDTARATASAPAASSLVTTNNTNVAPVINNNTVVNVQGGAEVGNRVGKATSKAATEGSRAGVKAALVPTPG